MRSYCGKVITEEVLETEHEILDSSTLDKLTKLIRPCLCNTDLDQLIVERLNEGFVTRDHECLYYYNNRDTEDSLNRCTHCQGLIQAGVKFESKVDDEEGCAPTEEKVYHKNKSDFSLNLDTKGAFDLKYGVDEPEELSAVPKEDDDDHDYDHKCEEKRAAKRKRRNSIENEVDSECSVCLQKFERAHRLQTHLNGHTTRESYVKMIRCPLCPLEFSGAALNSHFVQQHDPDKGVCVECYKVYKRGYLATHYKTHAAYENRHKKKEKKLCPHCGKPFL